MKPGPIDTSFTPSSSADLASSVLQAVLAQKSEVGSVGKLPKRMLQILVLDPEPFLHHGEVVYRDNEIVGDVRAGSFGALLNFRGHTHTHTHTIYSTTVCLHIIGT